MREELQLKKSLTNNSWFQINKYGSRHMLASTGFAEEGIEWVISAAQGLVWRHLTIRLDAMLEAVELPAGIADLDAGLADVDGDTFPLK